jgi:hypothetical protein
MAAKRSLCDQRLDGVDAQEGADVRSAVALVPSDRSQKRKGAGTAPPTDGLVADPEQTGDLGCGEKPIRIEGLVGAEARV